MNCGVCGSSLHERRCEIPFKTKSLGTIYVPDVIHLVCGGCGDISLPPGESKKITDFANEKTALAVGRLPVALFVSASEAARLLGITKQAFSKNKRIRRGFIYATKVGKQVMYFLPSVEAYQEKSDGRILIMEYFHDLEKQLNELARSQNQITHRMYYIEADICAIQSEVHAAASKNVLVEDMQFFNEPRCLENRYVN